MSRSTPRLTLFPYTTLFRSFGDPGTRAAQTARVPQRRPHAGHGERDGETRQSPPEDRKSTRLNSSHTVISYAVFCLKKKKTKSSELHAEIAMSTHNVRE